MKTNCTIVSWLALSLAVVTTASAQTFTLLHTFTGSDGAYPVGSLILSNATLYGMTSGGNGAVFKMNINGSSCSNLHYFGLTGGNGNSPHAALTLSGTNLYGMTVEGGAGVGVAFRVSTNGIGYTALHYFNSRETNGAEPYGSLTLANGALYVVGSTGAFLRLNPVTGEIVWKKELSQVADSKVPMWGFSSSPLVLGPIVVVNGGGAGEKGLLAFDTASGDLR